MVRLADLVREIKTSSTRWIKEKELFPAFPGWQESYGAFTKSHAERDMIIEYIKNQQEHHKHESSADEFRRLLREAGIKFDERYLE